MQVLIDTFLKQIELPDPQSHKGQNGKLLIIGGSELFHAASKWSLDIASKFVDMVFYSSVPSNNELINQAKSTFWNGIVIPRDEVKNYATEADCILIGPGMERTEETKNITTGLLQTFPDKKWVIDAGALQMVAPEQLPVSSIITPHQTELERLLANGQQTTIDAITARGITVVLKGPVDRIMRGGQVIEVAGGNAGMTKGGTGDTLAGLVAALYCTHDALTAAVVGSFTNKKTGELLYETVGPNFNASDLVSAIPQVFWRELQRVSAV